jgi:hypothetical protein
MCSRLWSPTTIDSQKVEAMALSKIRCRRLGVLMIGAILIAIVAAIAMPKQTRKSDTDGHRHTNRLIHETSPYLLQHAHNPVNWYPWGEEAFEKAKQEDKPIFLSIGYSSCHWCHVMERESFADEGIAALLNDNFIAIKVDREERPDVDEIYMTAVQMMSGQGGWPMSSFLTPDGKPFFGGTYFPRDEFADLLNRIHEAWTDPAKRKQIDELAERVGGAIGQAASHTPPAGTVSPALFGPVVKSYLEQFDKQDGGFGPAPKFPPSMCLALMLAEHRKKPDPQLLHAVTFTLDRMARGGIYDQVGGGFHRYSTDEKWLVPHFEKMLYDNALLSWIYLEAFRDTQNSYYRRIATETLDFILRELHDPQGGFWSTLDADSEGEEGKFYVWSPQEVISVLGKADGELFNRIYDITPAGNFEGRSIPNLIAKSVDEWAKELNTSPNRLWQRLDAMRARLLAVRGKRVRPGLDDKVLTSWNGLMIRSFALGYDVTGEERYREAAESAAAFLLSTMRKDGKLRHSYRQGKTQPQAFLEDYSFLIVGLLELHRATGKGRWLKEAQALTHVMISGFWSERDGSFYSVPHDHEVLLARLNSAEDSATPSGQSMAALALVQLARRSEDADLRAKAQRILNTYVVIMQRYPAAMPNMLLAAHQYFTPTDRTATQIQKELPVQVSLAGMPSSVKPGQTFEVSVQFAVRPGWHIHAEKPADPSLIGTRVEPAAGPFQLVSATYPAARTVRLGFRSEPLRVYTGDAVVRLRLRALPGARAEALRLRVRYQACNDRICERSIEKLLTPSVSLNTASATRRKGTR